MKDVSTEPTLHVLLVEDDRKLADLTREYLTGHGVVVTHVADGKAGLDEAVHTRFDAVLLDLMLPGMDGLTVCRELRGRSDVPILVLTARGEEADRVMGLEMGADDYLAKPFSPRELLARLRAVTRRAVLDGRELALTGYEFDLLRALVERAGRVLSREQLMELAKGNAEEAFDRSIDVHVSRLRQKMGDDPKRPRLIKTVRGSGYLLAGEGE